MGINFRLLLGHFHVPGQIANNGYAKVLGGNRGVLWDCASSEFETSRSRSFPDPLVNGNKDSGNEIDHSHKTSFLSL